MFSRRLLSSCRRSFDARQFRVCRQIADRRSSDDRSKRTFDDATDENAVSGLLKNAANYNESSDKTWSTTPYPEGAPSSPENEIVKPPTTDPTTTSIVVFPGQGTLKLGMIKRYMKFPRVRELYDTANEVLGYDILKMSLEGPTDRLQRTEFNQPATVVASLAALEQLWEERPAAIEGCRAVAGYSVGEITALIFSGAMSIDAGIRLAGVRGAAMQKASDATPQGMLNVFCSASAKLSDACKDAEKWALDMGVENPMCRVAIYLYTQGKVLAGNDEALRYIEDKGSEMGLRNVRRVPVSGAFHTPMMEPALKSFMKALGNVTLEEPRIEVYSNVTAKPYRSTRDIKKYLPKQMVSPVRWEQVTQALYSRPPGTPFPRTFDLGSGGTMKSIIKRINAKAWDNCYEL